MIPKTCIVFTYASKHVVKNWKRCCSCCVSLNNLKKIYVDKCSPELYKTPRISFYRFFKYNSRFCSSVENVDKGDSKENSKENKDKVTECDKIGRIKTLSLNVNEEDKSQKCQSKGIAPKILEVIAPKLASTKKVFEDTGITKKGDKEVIIEKKLENSGNQDVSKKSEGKPAYKRRKPVDLEASSLDRNFMTPIRAMNDFLLKPSDLESLPKTKRRSPYEDEPSFTVYWRKDVEAKALEVWGSKENLQKQMLLRDIKRKQHQQNIFTVKQRLKDYRKELQGTFSATEDSKDYGLMGRSGKVVLTAVAINASNCLFKFIAWLYTGSHSMFSECVHSLADTINQIILVYGIQKSVQTADSEHPYGYSKMKYISSLISGVGIFCVGAGLSMYHGVMGIITPEPIEDFFWAYFILAGSLVSEGATLLVAFNSLRKGAKEKNMSLNEYILTSQDPSVNVVLMEDTAAVAGVAIAAACMGWSTFSHNPLADAFGSLLIGGLLASVASFIIYSNVNALVGRSINQESLDKINAELEADVMVRAIYDVKGIDMGNSLVRYKAEVDFDGRELTRAYLDKQDLNIILDEINKIENIDQVEQFLLKHGENIVDMLGAEIDRIERKLRKKHPEIRHVDLELL
ncbi:zinc transporter 9 [Agrilus planipennis]|uniref:Proton-coupled zinc antiporter SLC30A9, mitochondrial n=1 Tax=Agrilus planipennis TaxID=224129 RepID=A0A1W4X191_AGRPL|nr:zinc transporter 9 [Agrilus planipennis]